MRPIFLLALALYLMPAAAQAASFSCSAAQSPNEIAICSDPTLSATDTTMALAYVGAIAGLTEEAEIVMRNGQRQWLNFADTVCADENLRGDDVPEVERVSCLQRLYDARLGVLEQSRMVGGLRFFTVDTYKALPDDHERFKLGLKVVSSLRVDGDTPMAKAFNAYMTQVTEDHTGQYQDFGGTDMDDSAPHEDNDLLMSLESINDSRISVRMDIAWYGHGAAHGNESAGRFHFLREAARPLVASDIFEGKRWQQVLAGMIAERASLDLREGEVTYDAEGMMGKANDPTSWSFTPAGLVIQFQDQEVSPGMPEVSVAWRPLDNELAGDAYAIAIWE